MEHDSVSGLRKTIQAEILEEDQGKEKEVKSMDEKNIPPLVRYHSDQEFKALCVKWIEDPNRKDGTEQEIIRRAEDMGIDTDILFQEMHEAYTCEVIRKNALVRERMRKDGKY